MKKLFVILCLSICLAGCNNLGNLKSRIAKLEGQVLLLNWIAENRNSIILDPTESGYGRLDTTSGFFLVACKSAEPYLDGQKITLEIGNPTTATYDGFTLKVQYGKQYNYKTMNYANWEKSLQTVEKSFTNRLMPGSWNEIELILAPSKPEEVRYMRVNMETNSVLLH